MPLISYLVTEAWFIATSVEPDQEPIRSASCPNLVSLQDPIRLGGLLLTALMRARSLLGWLLGRMSHEWHDLDSFCNHTASHSCICLLAQPEAVFRWQWFAWDSLQKLEKRDSGQHDRICLVATAFLFSRSLQHLVDVIQTWKNETKLGHYLFSNSGWRGLILISHYLLQSNRCLGVLEKIPLRTT